MFLRIPGVLFFLIWGLLFVVWTLFAGGGIALMRTAASWAAEAEPRTHNVASIGAVKCLGYLMFGECKSALMHGLLEDHR